jgi:hypothetical protein
LVAEGVLVEVGGRLLFSRDYEFSSASATGSTVRGGNTNGLKAWKNIAGILLKDLEGNE